MSNLNTNGFDKNPQNINRKWRPKKWVSAVNAELQEKGYEPAKKSDIENTYLHLINLPEEELATLLRDKKQPILVSIIIKNMLDRKQGFNIIEKMLDRSIWRPTNTIANPDGTPILWDFSVNIITNENKSET